MVKFRVAEIAIQSRMGSILQQELLNLVTIERLLQILERDHPLEALLSHEALELAQFVVQEEVLYKWLLHRRKVV